MGAEGHSFAISRARDGGFESGGLRSFFEYRDLGIQGATKGAFGAHVIRARERCEAATGRHRHALGFQMVYVLKGACTFWYDRQGSFDLEPGDCVYQPPGIAHELRSCSADCELLEITMPAEFDTEDA
jgi:mannose-6-phosphate isomerase-like protein (cupin superfamily)